MTNITNYTDNNLLFMSLFFVIILVGDGRGLCYQSLHALHVRTDFTRTLKLISLLV